jgi:outer membrane protein assembly factor BamB
MFKLALAIAGLALALLVPAAHAADPWPSDGGNAFNWRLSPTGAPSPGQAPNMRKLWEVKLEGAVSGTPILGDNNGVYVGTEAGSVYGLPQDRAGQGSGVPDQGVVAGPQGIVFWAQYIQGPIRSSLLKVGNTIFAIANIPNRPRIYALDAQEGTIKWSTQLDSQTGVDSCAAPQYASSLGLVIVGLADCSAEKAGGASTVRGAVAAINPTTGAMVWKTYLALPAQTGAGVKGTPAVWDAAPGGGKVYVATGHAYGTLAGPYTDSIVELDLSTGAIVNSFQASAGDTSSNGQPVDPGKRVGFNGTPILVGKSTPYIGAGAGDGKYYVVNASTMQLVSATQIQLPGDILGITASSAWDRFDSSPNGTIVGVSTTPTYYFGINPDDGQQKFMFPATDAVHGGAVSLSEHYLWSASLEGTLDVQSAVDGHTAWKVPIGTPTVGGVSMYKERVFVAEGIPGGTEGGLVAYYVPKK